MRTYVVIGNGTNKNGEPYSRVVPIVELPGGNAYLDLKASVYLSKSYPLLKRFSSEMKEA